ncbi:GNAT family N-acetyltransferase [Streptomyces sp. NPDC101160]|uniref:GNAT family N-acetyltransferase n=1 Tax=Streptomyces sp. NPDC101160 TaxID=3366118 RepID=UPI0037FB3830
MEVLGRVGPVSLRVVGAGDWEVWRQARLAALGESPHAFKARLADWESGGEARWRERLAMAGAYNVVALLEGEGEVEGEGYGEVVGVAAGMPGGEPGVRELRSVWVSPRVRGRGVGDRLIAAVEAWAREAGATRLTLGVLPGNGPALALYRRHGFVVAEKGGEGQGDEEVVMAKSI